MSLISLFRVCTMASSIKEDRAAVIALYRKGKTAGNIFKLLKHAGFNRRFIYRTIDRFNETQGIEDRHRKGRPKSVRTAEKIKAVRNRILRNPLRKQSILSREMNISARSLSRLIREDLGLRAYRRYTGHTLNSRLKKMRKERSKVLLRRYGDEAYRSILFTDEKIFTIEEKFNRQNDRVYARSSREATEMVGRVERGHHPASVMVWWGVSWKGVTELHFCEKGVKTSARVYKETVLQDLVLPLNETLFNGAHWVFQQDSAPAHKARITQAWLRDHLPEFISTEEWPSASPDLNPLDYKLWSYLEAQACRTRHPNIDSLKRALVRAVDEIPLEKVRAAIDDWPRRLKACVKSNGGHFE